MPKSRINVVRSWDEVNYLEYLKLKFYKKTKRLNFFQKVCLGFIYKYNCFFFLTSNEVSEGSERFVLLLISYRTLYLNK